MTMPTTMMPTTTMQDAHDEAVSEGAPRLLDKPRRRSFTAEYKLRIRGDLRATGRPLPGSPEHPHAWLRCGAAPSRSSTASGRGRGRSPSPPSHELARSRSPRASVLLLKFVG